MGAARPPPGPSSQPRDPADPDAATLLAQLSGGAAVTISLGRRFPHADSCWLEVWGTEGYERVPFMWDAAGRRGVPQLDASPGRGVCPRGPGRRA